MANTSPPDSENVCSVLLAKDHLLHAAPNPGYIVLCGRDIAYPRHPNLPCSSAHVETALEYVRKLRRRNGDLHLARLDVRQELDGVFMQVQIERHVTELLNDAIPLPRPFFEIVCRINAGVNLDEIKIFKERLYLKELYRRPDEEIHDPRRIFFLRGHVDNHVFCSFNLGWSEEGGEAKPIKTSAAAVLQNLWGMESTKDLTIIAGNGKELKCHRILFESHNDVLAAMVSPMNGMVESETGIVKMSENSERGLTHFVRYLYGMELSPDEISCELTVELLKTADKYGLPDLLNGLVQMLYKKEKEWFTPDNLLELHFLVKNLDALGKLEEYLLKNVMLRLNLEIRSCDRFKELMQTDPTAANDLVWKLFDLASSELAKLKE